MPLFRCYYFVGTFKHTITNEVKKVLCRPHSDVIQSTTLKAEYTYHQSWPNLIDSNHIGTCPSLEMGVYIYERNIISRSLVTLTSNNVQEVHTSTPNIITRSTFMFLVWVLHDTVLMCFSYNSQELHTSTPNIITRSTLVFLVCVIHGIVFMWFSYNSQ